MPPYMCVCVRAHVIQYIQTSSCKTKALAPAKTADQVNTALAIAHNHVRVITNYRAISLGTV